MRKSRKTSRFVFTDIRDLYELLLQKEALENRLQQQQLQGQHEIVRKANRSPSLRLRFGRRADPLLTVRALHVSFSLIWFPSSDQVADMCHQCITDGTYRMLDKSIHQNTCSRALPMKSTAAWLVKKFLASKGPDKFLNMLIRSSH
jgi:hypothetical protein